MLSAAAFCCWRVVLAITQPRPCTWDNTNCPLRPAPPCPCPPATGPLLNYGAPLDLLPLLLRGQLTVNPKSPGPFCLGMWHGARIGPKGQPEAHRAAFGGRWRAVQLKLGFGCPVWVWVLVLACWCCWMWCVFSTDTTSGHKRAKADKKQK